MKKYVKIESKGIIEAGAFTLLGASTKKEDNTKIGFFGSGLKYSIAWLLRNKIDFKVFAEYKQIVFTTLPAPFREMEFDVICVDGIQTSLTTAMGGDWQAWYTLREIYCNALDEAEAAISIVDEKDCVPVEDKTVFYFETTEQFKEILDEWDMYFSENRKDLVYSDADFNQVYNGGDKTLIYRKGIRCMFLKEEKSTFNYDLSWVEINESRVIKDEWMFKWKLREFLQKIKDRKVISQLLNTINKTWEKGLNWQYGGNNYSDVWLEVIGKKTLVPYENAGFWEEWIKDDPFDFLILPANMIESLKEKFLDKIKVIGDVEGVSGSGDFRVIASFTKKQQYLLDEALAFLKDASYDVNYPIKLVAFTKETVRGQAKDKTILLSEKLFDMGRKEIVAVIIEEQEHLVTGYGDETRAFQTHFIHKFLTSLEDKVGRYL